MHGHLAPGGGIFILTWIIFIRRGFLSVCLWFRVREFFEGYQREPQAHG